MYEIVESAGAGRPVWHALRAAEALSLGEALPVTHANEPNTGAVKRWTSLKEARSLGVAPTRNTLRNAGMYPAQVDVVAARDTDGGGFVALIVPR